jgi:hypothetical protein
VSATDSATALQAAGSVGVTNYLSSAATNPPVTMSLTSFVAKPTSVPTNQPPTAAFTSSCTNLACSFDATASSDPDGTIAGEPVCRRLAAYRGRRHVHRYLRSTSSTDTDLVLVISIDKTPDSNGVYFTVTPRGVSSTTEYRARVRINSAVALRLTRLVAGTETVLVNEMTLAGLTYTGGHVSDHPGPGRSAMAQRPFGRGCGRPARPKPSTLAGQHHRSTRRAPGGRIGRGHVPTCPAGRPSARPS